MKYLRESNSGRFLPGFLFLFIASYILASNIERIDLFELNKWLSANTLHFGPVQGEAIDSKGLHFPENQNLIHLFENSPQRRRQSFKFILDIHRLEIIHFRITGTSISGDFSITPEIFGGDPVGLHSVELLHDRGFLSFVVDGKVVDKTDRSDFGVTGYVIEDINSDFHVRKIIYDPPLEDYGANISLAPVFSKRIRKLIFALCVALVFLLICFGAVADAASCMQKALFIVPPLVATFFPLKSDLLETLILSALCSGGIIAASSFPKSLTLKVVAIFAFPILVAAPVALLGGPSRYGLSAALATSGVILVLLQLMFAKTNVRGFVFIFLTCFALSLSGLEASLRLSAMAQIAKPMNVGAAFDTRDDLFYAPGDLFDDSVPLRVQRLNFRDRTVNLKADEGVFRIIAMGGSTTWGDGIEHVSYTWSGQLETILNNEFPKRRFEVLNGGVKGYNLFQVMLLFIRYAVHYHPDLLILYINTADSADTLGPYTYRELWLMKNEGRWDEIEKIMTKNTDPKAAQWIADAQGLLQKSQLYNLLAGAVVKTRTESLSPLAERISSLKEVNPDNDYRANLLEMIKICKDKGIRLLLVDEYEVGVDPYPGSKGQRVRKIMREQAAANGVDYLALNDEFQERDDKGSFVFSYDQAHLNHRGHEEVARTIARHLAAKVLLQ